MKKIKSFFKGMAEFRSMYTTSFPAPLDEAYDWGREWAHRITFRLFEPNPQAGLTPDLSSTTTVNRCINCRHWRDKAWTDKGWGICGNLKNEVKAGPLSMIRYYLKDDPTAAEELARHVEDGIRYPEDFGCIFFEAWKAS